MSGPRRDTISKPALRDLPRSGRRLVRFVRQYSAGLLISGVVFLLSLALYFPLYFIPSSSFRTHPILEFLSDMELKTLDMRFRLRGPIPPDPRIVIVAIDQKSEDVLGRFPFPRSYFAEALDFLRQAGARVVAFDINFPQPDENSALQSLQEVEKDYTAGGGGRSAKFQGQLNALLARADNDKRFAEALSHYPNAILGYFFLPSSETSSQDKKRVEDFVNYLSFQALKTVPHVVPAEYEKVSEISRFEGLSPDLPEFALYAKNFGYFNVIPDPDGTVRREPVVALFQGSYYPSLDVAAALAYKDIPLDQVSVVFNPNGLRYLEFGRTHLPTDPGGFVQIDFHGPAGTFPTYSLADVVERKLPGEDFKSRLVLIGPTATGIGDFAVTPFQKQAFSGVEVHANFIDNLLAGRFIRRGLSENLIDLGFILLFSLGAGVVLSVIPPVRATSVLIVMLGFFLWLAYYLFARDRIWIALFLPTAALTMNYAAIVSYRFFFEEREKKKVRMAFQQYVPPGLIAHLLESPELLRLGGEEKELTALFSDIRGFTTISEGLSPSGLVELLNEYLSAMTEVVFRNWGTLDKYIGDAVMAFWGAPFPQSDHALRSCRTALEMLKALDALRGDWKARGRPDIDIGVGINSGPMLVGNMGSKRRFNYTIMGDNVNLASRLEGLNKQYGTRIITSEFTFQSVAGHMVGRELDLIRVKGKTKPVKIFELLAVGEERAQFEDLTARFRDGLEAYRSARWEGATRIFEELQQDYPTDGPTQVFLERCRDLIEQPPQGLWDGVYVMKTK